MAREQISTVKQALLIMALAPLLALFLVVLVNVGKAGTPFPDPSPTAHPTYVTGTVAPTPLCQDAASSRCWQTEGEDNVGPWTWRERAKVRAMLVPSCEVTGWTGPCTRFDESSPDTDLGWFTLTSQGRYRLPECQDAQGTGAPCVWPDADDAGRVSLFDWAAMAQGGWDLVSADLAQYLGPEDPQRDWRLCLIHVDETTTIACPDGFKIES